MALPQNLELISTVGRIGVVIAWERVGPRPVPLDASHVPVSAEAITPDWLTEVLCRDLPGAAVTDVRIEGGDNGTSTRRYLALEYNAAGESAGLPHRIFTKSTASFGSRLLLGVTGIVRGEAAFYNYARPSLTLRSPTAYFAGFDAESFRSLVLLEDLTQRAWTFPDPMDNPVDRADAEDIVSEIAAYHGAFWDSPRFDTDLCDLEPTPQWRENVNRKVGFAKRMATGLERAKDVLPGVLYSQRDEICPALMESLALHTGAPQTLLHQDLHLGNWLRDDTGRMGLYDWQCVARGHWALDVAYALGGCLDVDDRRDWEEDLLRLYLERLADGGVQTPPSFDAAWLAYRQQTLHGLTLGLFALGGNRFEPELQPRGYTLCAIDRLAHQVCDLDSITALAV